MSCGGGDDPKLELKHPEAPEKLATFEAYVNTGQLVELEDWKPEDYRLGMLRMAEHHANSEIVGALPEGEWITRAPSLRRKLALMAKVQDEVGHGQMLYRVSEDLGKPREQMLRDICECRTKYHNVFNYPVPTWADVCAIQWLVDGAAIMNQKSLAAGSYGPYVRTMNRINMEEAFHFKSGEDMVLTMMGGTRRQKNMVQAAFDRWWWPCLMFFGPRDNVSTHNSIFMRWRLKTASNDTLRQQYVDRFVPAARALGLRINLPGPANDDPAMPNLSLREDPKCTYDESLGHWGFTDPDWDEFFRVIRGNGPCNKERVGLRRFSYEQNRWVRNAVIGGFKKAG